MKKVILDVDTGSDDAIAIMMAVLSGKLDVIGITVTWGNRPVEDCVKNTLKVLELVKKDIPVYQGCPQAMVRYLTRQRNAALDQDGISISIDGKEYTVHPKEFPLPEPKTKKQKEHACTFLMNAVKSSKEKVILAAVGPLTNLGMSLRMCPEMKENIEKIVIMGGGVHKGNITPCAEANFYHDPEAAKIVLESGIPCDVVPLNATHSAEISLDNAKTLEETEKEPAVFAAKLIRQRIEALDKMHAGNGYSDAIHDALAVASLLDESVIEEWKTNGFDIDINGGSGDGALIVDERNNQEIKFPVRFAMKANQKKFFELMKEILGK